MPTAVDPYDRIKALHNAGRFALAARSAEAALEDAPHDARVWESLGVARHALRDYAQAMEALETATLIAPLSPAGQLALAACYLLTKRRDLARSIYRHLASQIARVSTHHLPNVASGLSRVGDRDLALEVWRERAYREPDNEDAVFAVAHVMGLLKYPTELILPIAHRAFRLSPDRARNRIALAIWHHQCGNHLDAYRLLTEVELEPLIAKCCPRRLTRLAELFDTIGDAPRRGACQSRLSEIGDSRASGS
jgi:tetratricopeptide (TPR) repeat protein